MTAHGLLDASTDPATVADWWRRWPEANIGLRTGVAFDVLDIDGPDGAASLREVAPGYKHDGPVSATGKGWHLLFEVTNAKNAANMRPKLDFRGQNGYIVAPPSIHPLGHAYAWLDGRGPDEPLPEATFWLLDLVFPAPVKEDRAPNPTAQRLAGQLDLATELGALGVALKPRGPRLFGRCPFHADDTPSLVVYPNETFYCFGCNAWGDALNVRHYAMNGSLR